MIALLLILLPLVAGLSAFLVKDDKSARSLALVASLATLAVSAYAWFLPSADPALAFSAEWMQGVGSSFSVKISGLSQLLCFLNAVAYPLVIISTWRSPYNRANNFFALMLLAQAGMMGVFLSADALLFYFFWELALIPMYFVCSQWGGEKRIAVTFKFFIYTFVGSLLMLIGLLYIYSRTPGHSFAMESFYNTMMSRNEQSVAFWLMFGAFAIKMPVFPLHTWQPDTYEQSPTGATMILSGVMVKMGLFGLLAWVFPVLPLASYLWADFITLVALIGVIYASLIAIRQDDLKRLVAYSSIAHIGLMCAAAFAHNTSGMQGLMIQMFNHGINIIGLWIVIELIERQFGTRKISELGGLAQKAPAMAILLTVVALANIALPLTNAFPGEFLMFNGIFSSETRYNVWFIVLAGLGIILSAIYTLNMIRKVFFGNTNELTAAAQDITFNEKLALGLIVTGIFWLGIFPQCLLDQTVSASEAALHKITGLLGTGK